MPFATAYKRDAQPFFTDSPAAWAQALKKATKAAPAKSGDQEIYLDAVLFNVTHGAVTAMEQEERLTGRLATRKFSPAAGVARVGEYERQIYDLVFKGDFEAIQSIVIPQKTTFTSHPNFSRNAKLVELSKELAPKLVALHAAMTDDEHTQFMKEGALPGTPLGAEIKALLKNIPDNLTIREKRSRADELKETTLDMISTVMEAASEHLRIMDTRRKSLWKTKSKKIKPEEDVDTVPAKPAKPENLESKASQNKWAAAVNKWKDKVEKWSDETRQPLSEEEYERMENTPVQQMPEFSNLKQLKAAAALLPEFNTWFLDGDGKRTVHAYDAEVAVPAIKRATYEHYVKLLDDLPEQIGKVDVGTMAAKLKSAIKTLTTVEKLATARMDAFNTLHDLYEKKNKTQSHTLERDYDTALTNAQACSAAYDNYLHENGNAAINVLKHDYAADIKAAVGTVLEKNYAGTVTISDKNKKNAEDLYIKLERYGNFAIRIQRRENAKEYNTVFKFLVQNNPNIRKALAKELKVNEAHISAKLTKPEFYSQAIEAFAKSAADPNDTLRIRDKKKGLLASYKELSSKLEKRLVKSNGAHKKKDDTEEQESLMEPLEERELLALDALGMYRMASLYPEAFKGGFVIAEFAQPSATLLGSKNNKGLTEEQKAKIDEKIKAEVARTGKNDMLLQLAFSHAMGAPNAEIIPLHEDPSTMQYAADAQAALRSEDVVEYMKKWIDATTEAKAEKKALRYLDKNGKPQLLTAYQYMRQAGFSAKQIKQAGFSNDEIKELKDTYVLAGPHDMEACSDNNKRSGTAGSELADQSVRDKVAANMRMIRKIRSMIQKIGKKKFAIVKPKYLGQGGSIMRAVEIPLDTGQCTMQGEHINNLTAAALAHKTFNYTMGRLQMNQDAALGKEPSEELKMLAHEFPHIGNILGLPAGPILDDERRQMIHAVERRVASTRDDDRYNQFLETYGEKVENYSSRPDNKDGSKKLTFNEGRAIGIAGNEFGIFSNVIAFGEMFTPLGTEDKGSNIKRMKLWKQKDPMIQQLVTAACLTANFVDLKQKWQRGGFDYDEKNNTISRRKKNGELVTIALSDLKKEYDNGKKEVTVNKGQKNQLIYDAGDLVMAHLTDQYYRMVHGLKELQGKPNLKDPIEFLPKEWHGDINYLKYLNSRILKEWHETKETREKADKKEDPDYEDRKNKGKLALDAYYLLHEAGVIYPLTALLHKDMYGAHSQASSLLEAMHGKAGENVGYSSRT